MYSHNERTFLDLHLFDGEGGAAPAAAPDAATDPAGGKTPASLAEKTRAAKNPLENVQYGKALDEDKPPLKAEKPTQTPVTSDTAEARRAEFEQLISGEYKDLFTERAQQMIDTRFKQTKLLEDEKKSLDPVIDMLCAKYGVDRKDVAALSKAIEDDSSYYEAEAEAKGLTVEQLKSMKRIERENAEFRRVEAERAQQENANRIYQRWAIEGAACKELFPGFDMRAECNNPQTGERFLNLLRSGVDVTAAYKVIHMDDIIGGSMQHAVQTAQQKTLNDIRARGMRPAENGNSGNAPSTVRKTDPSQLTNKDLAEISKRVMRGEKISF